MVQSFENETKELVHVTAGGDIITATPEHPFYVPQRGWVGAIELRAGDILVQVNGEYAVVERIEHELLETPVTVYNFEVEGFHTYFVGDAGVLVHNRCGYNTPKGGGGVSDTVQVGDTTVTFGHGGRHLQGTNLTTEQVNRAIANDVVNTKLMRNLCLVKCIKNKERG